MLPHPIKREDRHAPENEAVSHAGGRVCDDRLHHHHRLDTDIAALEDVAQETKLRQLALESEQSAMRQELALKDTDSYIMEKARTLYGYLMPGEIRFEVSNPDSLYDTPEAIVVGEGE